MINRLKTFASVHKLSRLHQTVINLSLLTLCCIIAALLLVNHAKTSSIDNVAKEWAAENIFGDATVTGVYYQGSSDEADVYICSPRENGSMYEATLFMGKKNFGWEYFGSAILNGPMTSRNDNYEYLEDPQITLGGYNTGYIKNCETFREFGNLNKVSMLKKQTSDEDITVYISICRFDEGDSLTESKGCKTEFSVNMKTKEVASYNVEKNPKSGAYLELSEDRMVFMAETLEDVFMS